MGNCYTCNFNTKNIYSINPLIEYQQNQKQGNSTKTYVAIKFPHGYAGIEYCNSIKSFIHCSNINKWLSQIYQKELVNKWTNWQIYNDETAHIVNNLNTKSHHKKGHCKGIVAWNNKRISWLCHSVPNFPKMFDQNGISEIEHGELIYGQSFQYIEVDFSADVLYKILNQLHIMEANIYLERGVLKLENIFSEKQMIQTCNLTDTIIHVAKSPHNNIDIYSEYLAKEYPGCWQVETWIRGHHIESSSNLSLISLDDTIIDITGIKFENVCWTESQDHSKWAVCLTNSYYWIGDLNRMTSQYKRGGGGFICKNEDISKAFYKLIA